jgi:hypothetical protein
VAAVATATVSSHPFQRAIQASIKSAVAAVLSERSSKVALSTPDLGVLFRSALSQANPALAEKIPPRVRVAISALGEGWASRAIMDLLRLSRRLAGFVVALFVLGVACAAGGFALARDRRRALLDTSVHLIAAGVVLLVLKAAGGWVLQSAGSEPLSREASAGVWAAFTAGIRGWALTLSLVGLVTAASAQSVLDRISFADALAWFWRFVQDPPGGVWGRLGRSVLFVIVGAAAVAYPRDVLAWVTLAAGGALVFIGVREALALLGTQGAVIGDRALRAAGMGVRRVAMVAAATALLAWGAFAMMRPAPPSEAVAAGVCNGSAALCERPLDQVTFRGAHNAMSAPDVPGWMFPQHERGVATQLTDGIRAFLIDVHYGRPAGASVVTDLDSETASRAKIEEAVGPEGVDAALRIRDRFAGGDLGTRGLYLCHGFCELGAQPLGPWLATLADFLVQHPDEVVVLVIEDYVAPEDLAAEFDRAGLSDLVYRGTGRAPWPALRTLIDTRQRVVVMTESERGLKPTILAVDFYRTGDVVGVARALNK